MPLLEKQPLDLTSWLETGEPPRKLTQRARSAHNSIAHRVSSGERKSKINLPTTNAKMLKGPARPSARTVHILPPTTRRLLTSSAESRSLGQQSPQNDFAFWATSSQQNRPGHVGACCCSEDRSLTGHAVLPCSRHPWDPPSCSVSIPLNKTNTTPVRQQSSPKINRWL